MEPVYFNCSLSRRIWVPIIFLITLALPYLNYLFLMGTLSGLSLFLPLVIVLPIAIAFGSIARWKIDAGKLYYRNSRFSWEEITKKEIEILEYKPGWGIRPVWILKGTKNGKVFKYKIKADNFKWNADFIRELYQYLELAIPVEVESVLDNRWDAGIRWRKITGYLWFLTALLNGVLFFRIFPQGMDFSGYFHFIILSILAIIPLVLSYSVFIPEKSFNKSIFWMIVLLFIPLYFVSLQYPTDFDDNHTFFIWGIMMAFSLGMGILFLSKKVQEQCLAVILGSLAAALIFWLVPLSQIPHPQFQQVQIPPGYTYISAELEYHSAVMSIRKFRDAPRLMVWDIPRAKAEIYDFPPLPMKQFHNWKNSISPDNQTILSIVKDTDFTHSFLVCFNLGKSAELLKTKIFPGVGGNRISWSPTGKWTAIYEKTAMETSQNIWFLNMETQESVKPIPFNNCSIRELRWESDTVLYCLTCIYPETKRFKKPLNDKGGYTLWKLVLDSTHPEEGFIAWKMDIFPETATQVRFYEPSPILSYLEGSQKIYHFVRLDTKEEIRLPREKTTVDPSLIAFNSDGTRYLHIEYSSQYSNKQSGTIFAFIRQIPFKLLETEISSGISKTLFTSKQDISYLSYTPEGEKLFFIDTRNTPFERMRGFYVVDRNTKQYWKVLPRRHPLPVNYEEIFREQINSDGRYCLLLHNPFDEKGWIGKNALTVAIMPGEKKESSGNKQ